jgi:branched-subunit amino acid transport protein
MNIWLTMLAAGILTYATRLSFIMILGQREVSPRLQQALRFVPPAVLSALIFPDLLFPNGALDPSLGNERLIAGILATAVAWRTKNVVATIVAGMATLLLLQAIF